MDSSIQKQVYVVCPKDTCSALYKLEDKQGVPMCRLKRFVENPWEFSVMMQTGSVSGNHIKFFN